MDLPAVYVRKMLNARAAVRMVFLSLTGARTQNGVKTGNAAYQKMSWDVTNVLTVNAGKACSRIK